MKENNILPTGWILTTLEEISIKLRSGGTPSTSNPKFYKNGHIPFVKIDDITDNYKFLDKTKTMITEDGIENSASWIVPKNSLLYSIYASYGIPIINRIPVATSQAIIAYIPPPNLINLEFIFYFLTSIKDELISKGTTQKNLSAGLVRGIKIRLPPLNEQKRIVTKIEELLSKIDSTTELLNKTKLQLKQFRQSLLNSAFEGELTSNWRKNNPNVKSAFELIKEIQNNRINQFEIESDKKKQNKLKKNLKISILGKNPQISSWMNVKLENLVYIAGRIGWRGLKADEYTKKGPLFLSAYNLIDGDHVDFTQVNHISKERYQESPEIQLQNNDILLIKDGSGIGKISIVKNLIEPATVNSSLLIIRSNEAFSPEFLFYFLYGPKLQNIVKERITGSAIPHLFQHDIKQFQLSLPPLEEQHEIAKIIKNSLTNIRKTEEIILTELLKIQGLRMSILKQAFEGKLVPQDPNDESANLLLEKIKKKQNLIKN